VLVNYQDVILPLTALRRLGTDDKFMRHLAQVVRNGLGDRAGTCIDPKCQLVHGTVCVVTCQRSPEPVLSSSGRGWKPRVRATSLYEAAPGR
jgi:hypothetical protein